MKAAFRSRLLASTLILSSAAFATPAFAQDTTATEDTAAEQPEIVVTGSLISNPNLQSTSPVSVIGEEEIQLRQANVAEELLREMPGAVPSIGSAVNNGNGGSSFVNLRGLGSNRNLVLLDGVRLTPAELAGRVDLNNIPLALVERVDVLTGGASSTYGADAVGGVVNFITKSDFSGVDMNVSEQLTQKGDGNFLRGDLTIGANLDDGRGNVVFSIGYQESDPVYFGGDRTNSQLTLESYDEFYVAGQGSATTLPSRFVLGGGVPTSQVSPDGTGIQPYYAAYNFNPFNVFQTPFQRYNMYSAAHYDVTDHITVYGRGLYSNNTVNTIIAPSGIFNSSVTVPVSNPFLSAAQRTYFCNNADTNTAVAGNQTLTPAECAAAATALSPTNAAYRTFTFNVARRTEEVGPRLSSYNTQIFDFRAGVRGDITSSITFDVFGAYGKSDNTQSIEGYVLLSRARQALLATNTTTCLNDTNGCVPLNIFGTNGSINAAMADFISDAAQTKVSTTLGQARGVISGDFGVSSPWAAEPISFAVGTEYREYTALQRADALAKTAGELGGAGGAAPDITGGFKVYEFFGEAVVPLISDKPFFHELTAEGGIRQSHYEVDAAGKPTFSTTTWKAAGSWSPVEDIRFRGNYQHAVRAPNIGELFSPVSTGLTNLGTDPCAGAAPTTNANLRAVCLAQGAPAAQIGFITNPTAGQANATGGGNINLKPEVANTYTFGAVFKPTFFRGFTASIDYYNIKVNGAVSSPTPGDLITACFGATPTSPPASAATSAACTIIRRNPTSGNLDGDPATTPGLFAAISNLGVIKTDGIDLSLSYTRGLGTLFDEPVRISVGFNGNYTAHSKFKATPSALDRECVGYYSVNCGSIQPKYQFNTRTTLSFGPADISLLWRYIHNVKFEPAQLADDLAAATAAGCTAPLGADPDGCIVDPRFRSIKAKNYFDLSTRFSVTDNFTLTMTVQNLFDLEPPTVGGTVGSTTYNGGNTYPSTYDALGRRFAVSGRVTF